LTAEKYDSLINQFNLNNFLNLNYNQLGLCTDLPIRSLKFNYNCNINYTLRQEGCSSDVPDNLIYLEKLVDEVTNSKQWTE